MAINLSRNTRVFFTTNVDPSTGVLTDASTGFGAWSAANTFEIQVQEGYAFTQGTNSQTITLDEAGEVPVRGQRSFNTALNPVDFNFSTYVRPTKATNVTAIEKCLWNAFFNEKAIDTTGIELTSIERATTLTPIVTMISASTLTEGEFYQIGGVTSDTSWNAPVKVTAVSGSGPYTATGTMAKAPAVGAGVAGTGSTINAYVGAWSEDPGFAYTSTLPSQKNQLQKFAMIFAVDNVLYAVDNCCLTQASMDFALDGIAMIAWTGQGTALKRLDNAVVGDITPKTTYATSANFITNKLSTVTLESNIGGGGTVYNLPLTGGNITFNNNVQYITPNNLGTVNQAIGYFTGTRAVSGSINAYLKTGDAGDAGDLLSDVLALSGNTAEFKYKMQIEVGGAGNAIKVELDMEGVSLQVPTVDTAEVISTTVNFTAQAHDPTLSNNNFDIAGSNEMIVRYYSS